MPGSAVLTNEIRPDRRSDGQQHCGAKDMCGESRVSGPFSGWVRLAVGLVCFFGGWASVESELRGAAASCQDPAGLEGLEELIPDLDACYRELHQHPEVSLKEFETARRLAGWLRDAGLEVTEGVGGLGVVGVLANGAGPVVMLRADMDGLPVREQTGLDWASQATVTNDEGEPVSVMHACGHDMHMATCLGAARWLSGHRDRWRGTLIVIGQPAEEIVQGAVRMVADGLFTRFPKPSWVIGVHVSASMPSGEVGIVPGPASAASDSVDITFYGRGGHGAAPHLAVDPVVMAARAVVAMQTIVAREIDPFDPAVVTVGMFHAGTKRNIIPDEARIQLTVRSYKPEVQQRILAAIERIAKGEAAAAGAPREPDVQIISQQSAGVVVNDPELSARLLSALQRPLGRESVKLAEPVMTSEDFGVYGRAAGVPSIQLRLGAVEPRVYLEAREQGRLHELPGLHTARFAPDRIRTLRTGTAALAWTVLELLGHGVTGGRSRPPVRDPLRREPGGRGAVALVQSAVPPASTIRE